MGSCFGNADGVDVLIENRLFFPKNICSLFSKFYGKYRRKDKGIDGSDKKTKKKT